MAKQKSNQKQIEQNLRETFTQVDKDGKPRTMVIEAQYLAQANGVSLLEMVNRVSKSFAHMCITHVDKPGVLGCELVIKRSPTHPANSGTDSIDQLLGTTPAQYDTDGKRVN